MPRLEWSTDGLVNHSKCIFLRQTRVRGLMLLKCGAFNDGGAGFENLCRHLQLLFSLPPTTINRGSATALTEADLTSNGHTPHLSTNIRAQLKPLLFLTIRPFLHTLHHHSGSELPAYEREKTRDDSGGMLVEWNRDARNQTLTGRCVNNKAVSGTRLLRAFVGIWRAQ